MDSPLRSTFLFFFVQELQLELEQKLGKPFAWLVDHFPNGKPWVFALFWYVYLRVAIENAGKW